MKFATRSTLATLWLLTAFSLPQAAWTGEETEAVEPCTPEEIHIQLETQGEVSFVSGGIGRCEALEMQRVARDYPLELVFVKKTPSYETYLASIPVVVTDSKGNFILDAVTNGPFLLASLPAGRYEVSANYNGEVKAQRVTVGKQHQRIVFVWREQVPPPEQ